MTPESVIFNTALQNLQEVLQGLKLWPHLSRHLWNRTPLAFSSPRSCSRVTCWWYWQDALLLPDAQCMSLLFSFPFPSCLSFGQQEFPESLMNILKKFKAALFWYEQIQPSILLYFERVFALSLQNYLRFRVFSLAIKYFLSSQSDLCYDAYTM